MKPLLLLLASQPLLAQHELRTAVTLAESSWGRSAHVAGIRYAQLGSCTNTRGIMAWSDFATRIISVNSQCDWQDTTYLQIIVTHEVGHLLIGQGHSLNRHSVMYYAPPRVPFYLFLDHPHITRADREAVKGAVEYGAVAARPSILRGGE